MVQHSDLSWAVQAPWDTLSPKVDEMSCFLLQCNAVQDGCITLDTSEAVCGATVFMERKTLKTRESYRISHAIGQPSGFR